MLHIRCGEDILSRLDEAGVPGLKLSWADPLCEGPWLPYERAFVRPLRARYLADRGALDFMGALDTLATADEALVDAADHDEVVLWFEHDLYDQPILAYLLTELAPLDRRGVRISLIQRSAHPGIARFIGLGQLDAAALGALFPLREQVTEATFELAARAVEAWTAPEPAALEALRRPDPALPHLAAAVDRYLAEYPALVNGLALSERLALAAIAGGARTARAVFAEVQERETHPWMGDAMLFARLRVLSEGAAPLIAVDDAWPTLLDLEGDPRLALTDIGREVLAGAADWLAVQPQERWMGGVHLRPGGTDWRWDEARGRVVVRGNLPGARRVGEESGSDDRR
jgi:hypothetical protein